MATMNLPTGLHVAAKPASLDRLSSAKNVGDLFFSDSRHRKRVNTSNQIMAVQSLEHIHGVNNNVYANYVNFNVPSVSFFSSLLTND